MSTVRRIDFDRLDALVSERIGAMKLFSGSLNSVESTEAHLYNAICRDLVLPAVYMLANFLDSVKIDHLEPNED